ncbi:MAG: TetR/AcrR family transcriptional regulator [Verrucomicrobia bacterium]|nr:TetR/AcrR family transcriptional regulator [Verrucomicrobiota bacterium]
MGRTSDANERLMQAAIDLIWEESYGGVTIDDICKRAGVKKGSFYYFFQSKADLAVAALENMWKTEWKPNMDRQFSPSLRPMERIESYLDYLYTAQAEAHKKYGKVLGCAVNSLASEVSPQEEAEKISAKLREIMNRKLRYYESTIRDAAADGEIEPCDAKEAAQAFAGFLEGQVCQCRIMNDLTPLRSMPAMARNLLRAREPQIASS